MTPTRIPRAVASATLTLALIFAVGIGCEDKPREDAAVAERSTPSELPVIVQQAVAIAKEIEADPDDVEAVLERHNVTVERFEEMMYEISSDPLLASAYNAALE